MHVSEGEGMFMSSEGVIFRFDDRRQDMSLVQYVAPSVVGKQVAAYYLSSISQERCHPWNIEYFRKRIAVRNGDLYFAADGGLVATGVDGGVKLWAYPSTFLEAHNLGAWVEGNSALPECGLLNVVADDAEGSLLWVFSEHVSEGKYVTAFDVKRRMFSVPSRVPPDVSDIQPCGGYLYLACGSLARLSKKLWTIECPMKQPTEVSVRESVDNAFGRAGAAFFRGNHEDAIKILRGVVSANPDAVYERFVLAELLAECGGLRDPDAAADCLAPLLKSPFPESTRTYASFRTSEYLHAAGRPKEAVDVLRPRLAQYVYAVSNPSSGYYWNGAGLVWSVLYQDMAPDKKLREIREMGRLCRQGHPYFMDEVSTALGMPDAFGRDPYREKLKGVAAAEDCFAAGNVEGAFRSLNDASSRNMWDVWRNYRGSVPSLHNELTKYTLKCFADPAPSNILSPGIVATRMDMLPELRQHLREWDVRVDLLRKDSIGFDAYREGMALVYKDEYTQALAKIGTTSSTPKESFAEAERLRLAGTILKYGMGKDEEAEGFFTRGGRMYMRIADEMDDVDSKSLCLFLSARMSLLRGVPDRGAYEAVVGKYPGSLGGVAASRDLTGLTCKDEPPILCHGMDQGRPVRPGNRFRRHDMLAIVLPKSSLLDLLVYQDGVDLVWGWTDVAGVWTGTSLHTPGYRPRLGMGCIDFFRDRRFVTRRFYYFSAK